MQRKLRPRRPSYGRGYVCSFPFISYAVSSFARFILDDADYHIAREKNKLQQKRSAPSIDEERTDIQTQLSNNAKNRTKIER